MRKLDHWMEKKTVLLSMAIAAVLVESFVLPLLKLGGKYPLFSYMYIMFFAAAVLVMGVYAVLWQLILERVPLTTAYLRKGASYVLSFVWGRVLFHEEISRQQILGIVIIIIGMVVSTSDDE